MHREIFASIEQPKVHPEQMSLKEVQVQVAICWCFILTLAWIAIGAWRKGRRK